MTTHNSPVFIGLVPGEEAMGHSQPSTAFVLAVHGDVWWLLLQHNQTIKPISRYLPEQDYWAHPSLTTIPAWELQAGTRGRDRPTGC